MEPKRAKGTAPAVPDTLIPLDIFGSESLAADLLEQVRWRDSVESPCCRSNLTDKNGSYGPFQRYLCKNCDRTFNDKTATIFALVIRISFCKQPRTVFGQMLRLESDLVSRVLS